MLLRILTFFKWVYGNPLTFLVGIRRIPAYHVDYTTANTSYSIYIMTLLSHGTADWFSPVSVAYELTAPHLNIWQCFVVALAAHFKSPPPSPAPPVYIYYWVIMYAIEVMLYVQQQYS